MKKIEKKIEKIICDCEREYEVSKFMKSEIIRCVCGRNINVEECKVVSFVCSICKGGYIYVEKMKEIDSSTRKKVICMDCLNSVIEDTQNDIKNYETQIRNINDTISRERESLCKYQIARGDFREGLNQCAECEKKFENEKDLKEIETEIGKQLVCLPCLTNIVIEMDSDIYSMECKVVEEKKRLLGYRKVLENKNNEVELPMFEKCDDKKEDWEEE